MENMTIVYTKSFDRPCEKAVEPVCDMTGSQQTSQNYISRRTA
jgi:hypothetical protein